MIDLNKKIKGQELYINNNLKNIESCIILNKLPQDVTRISAHIVKDILENNFGNGPDMNAILCMFDNLFLSTAKSKSKSKSKHNGLFHLSVHVSKWVNKLTKINIGTSGYIYFSDILSDIQVILKLI